MVLVTGTSGFIGSHLLKNLIAKEGKENILAFTSAPVNNCDFLLHNNYQFDGNYSLNKNFDRVDIVIHAGAFIPKKSADANNYLTCFASIDSTKRMLEILPSSVKKIIFISTVDVYDSSGKISENTTVAPASLYGHSKYYCEKMVEAWAAEKNVSVIILRVGHVYGPGEEKYQKIIPVTINKLLQKQSPQIWGSGLETRSFIFIQDVVNAIINATKLDVKKETINLVSGTAESIRNVIDIIIKISGLGISPEMISSDTQGRNLEFDNSKMCSILCSESYVLQKGLSEEWNYMKALQHD